MIRTCIEFKNKDIETCNERKDKSGNSRAMEICIIDEIGEADFKS